MGRLVAIALVFASPVALGETAPGDRFVTSTPPSDELGADELAPALLADAGLTLAAGLLVGNLQSALGASAWPLGSVAGQALAPLATVPLLNAMLRHEGEAYDGLLVALAARLGLFATVVALAGPGSGLVDLSTVLLLAGGPVLDAWLASAPPRRPRTDAIGAGPWEIGARAGFSAVRVGEPAPGRGYDVQAHAGRLLGGRHLVGLQLRGSVLSDVPLRPVARGGTSAEAGVLWRVGASLEGSWSPSFALGLGVARTDLCDVDAAFGRGSSDPCARIEVPAGAAAGLVVPVDDDSAVTFAAMARVDLAAEVPLRHVSIGVDVGYLLRR